MYIKQGITNNFQWLQAEMARNATLAGLFAMRGSLYSVHAYYASAVLTGLQDTCLCVRMHVCMPMSKSRYNIPKLKSKK